MKKETPLQIEKKSAKDADYVMVRHPQGCTFHTTLNQVFAVGLLVFVLLFFALGCLLGRQANQQWAEIPYVVESPLLPSQMVEWDNSQNPQVERLERARYVLNEMDRLWSIPLATQQ